MSKMLEQLNKNKQDALEYLLRDFSPSLEGRTDWSRQDLKDVLVKDTSNRDSKNLLFDTIGQYIVDCENKSQTYLELHELHMRIFASIQLRIGEMLDNTAVHVLPNLTGIINLIVNSREIPQDLITKIRKDLEDCEGKIEGDNIGPEMQQRLLDVQKKIADALPNTD